MSGNKTGWDNGYWFGGNGLGRGFQYYEEYTTTESADIYFNPDKDVFKTPADVKKSYATLSFIISAAFVLPALTLIGRTLHKINSNEIKAFSHHLVYFTWLLVSCLLICILNILNLFDNFINSDEQSKSGKTCYYIYVIYGSLLTFVGLCLLCLALDITYLVLSTTQHLVEDRARKVKVHFMCFFLLIMCFFINNIPHMSLRVSFQSLNKCWKGNAYEGQVDTAALIDCGVLGVIVTATSITLLLSTCLIKCKTRGNELVIVPEYMRVLDEDIETVVENVQQEDNEEEESQARVSVDTPSSDLHAKSGESGRIYKRYEVDAEKLGDEKQQVNQQGSSRKRISSWKGEKDSSSKESSCHENSGYISEGNEQEGQIQRRQSLAFDSTRRRFKSDSEIQEPRSQTCTGVRKTRKHSSRKVLEDQVFEALENFFVTDPSKLLFKALGSQKQCELSAHLIDHNSDDKGTEEETSFNDKEVRIKKMRKRSKKLPLRKTKSLQRASSCKDRKSRTQWSTSSYKEKSNTVKCPSSFSANFSSEHGLETISLKEKTEHVTSSSRQTKVKDDDLKKDLIDFNKQTEFLKSPKIVVEDTDTGNSTSSARAYNGTKEINESCLSVNVDVHCSDTSQSISSLDTIGTDVECHFKDNTATQINPVSLKEHGLGNWVEFMPDTEHENRSGGRVKWEDEIKPDNDSCFVEVETQTEQMDAARAEELETDSVFKDMEKDSHTEVNTNGEIETEKDSGGKVESEMKQEGTDNCTTEIEIESSVEKRKEEMLLFKDYCKRYLLQPYKNVASLLLVYVICLLPQIVLDIYRIVIGRQETVQDQTDGVMSICSDAAMSVFLLAMTVMFLWQYRMRRKAKLDNILRTES
ncbi:uncharacterized protein LOC123566369 isoform X2 [Mercenaria mercenaria]|uniref:uncharacterized protein LOC123566369 isoform X2 n=1 Tax=Mercenaria mercenaria TaxID=6596 RepID=UPI00234EC5D7|nr:uncharacterized protein LOC123566369 isoform X2 [Mercenaria mercenaria]